MQTGAHFILIISLWIIGLVAAINILLPDVMQSLTVVRSIDTTISAGPTKPEEITTEELVSYTPLGIFTLLGF